MLGKYQTLGVKYVETKEFNVYVKTPINYRWSDMQMSEYLNLLAEYEWIIQLHLGAFWL